MLAHLRACPSRKSMLSLSSYQPSFQPLIQPSSNARVVAATEHEITTEV